ncbi:hypothetical protein [Capnocytophaga felis]|uniref:Uncharacterized protein n=1 Tax=Capnocytophaga felis TaxID=2267611 RepID=A0A5M4BBI3_9FLAO|nr:hypothetical protein [Capnocytophaga felis]GET46929.1 hypothetical protein RCZ01_22310 [Capnocytophaga felis]GET49449.1 hypothetical protein RCZ02_22800 [Capnocytophaga felis]
MLKKTQLKEIQKRLPEDILLIDSTTFDNYTDDEYLALLSWIKCFKNHYEKFQNNAPFYPHCAFVSTRLFIDFLYHNREEKAIYLNEIHIKTKKQMDAYIRLWGM